MRFCVSHSDTSVDESGAKVTLHEGMVVTAYDQDANDAGERDDLIASGVVERSPEWLQKHGSKMGVTN